MQTAQISFLELWQIQMHYDQQKKVTPFHVPGERFFNDLLLLNLKMLINKYKEYL